MGWLDSLLKRVAGRPPTDWTLLDALPDPGLGISGRPVVPDQCYIELYVESLRLERARQLATLFHPVIYSFASLAREGTNSATQASVTNPQNLATLDANNLDRVITVSKRIMGAMPWRGDPFGLELGLFSVKSGNLLTPLINYVTKVSDKAGISVATKLDPFLPLITEGLDMIAGQRTDTEIELAIDTDLSLTESKFCALIAKPRGTINAAGLAIDPQDHKLLQNGNPLQAAYCVFSIRSRKDNPDWGKIPALEESYADFKKAILSNIQREADEALSGFNRQVIVSPDLISADKTLLKDKARAFRDEAYPTGRTAGETNRQRFENRQLADLNLYDQPIKKQK
jgi:hypothetical protein